MNSISGSRYFGPTSFGPPVSLAMAFADGRLRALTVRRIVVSHEDHELVPEQHPPTVKPPRFEILSAVLVLEDATVRPARLLRLHELPDLIRSCQLPRSLGLDELHRLGRVIRKNGPVLVSI